MAEQKESSYLKFLYTNITWFTWNVLGKTDVFDNGQIIVSRFFSVPLLVDFLLGIVKGSAGGSPAKVLTLFSLSYCRQVKQQQNKKQVFLRPIQKQFHQLTLTQVNGLSQCRGRNTEFFMSVHSLRQFHRYFYLAYSDVSSLPQAAWPV